MSIFEKAEQLVEKVKDRLDGDDGDAETPAETPATMPSDSAVTPADVAESVRDPDLAHPEPPADEER